MLQWAVQRVAIPRGVSQSHKAALSSDWSLQLDSMKLESLVIADQHAAVNTFPGLVHTARHTMRVGCTRSCWTNSAPNCLHQLRFLASYRSLHKSRIYNKIKVEVKS